MKRAIFLLPLAIVAMLIQIRSGANADDAPKPKKDKKDDYIAALQAEVKKLRENLADKNQRITQLERGEQSKDARLKSKDELLARADLRFTKQIELCKSLQAELDKTNGQLNHLRKQKIVVSMWEHDNYLGEMLTFDLYPNPDKGSEVVHAGNMKDRRLKVVDIGILRGLPISWNDAVSSFKIERVQE